MIIVDDVYIYIFTIRCNDYTKYKQKMSDQTESSLELESEKPDLSDTIVRTSLVELTCLICCVLLFTVLPFILQSVKG